MHANARVPALALAVQVEEPRDGIKIPYCLSVRRRARRRVRGPSSSGTIARRSRGCATSSAEIIRARGSSEYESSGSVLSPRVPGQGVPRATRGQKALVIITTAAPMIHYVRGRSINGGPSLKLGCRAYRADACRRSVCMAVCARPVMAYGGYGLPICVYVYLRELERR